MVQEGNITPKDAIRHAEALNSIRVRGVIRLLAPAVPPNPSFCSPLQVRKKGDAQRILLMNMVKV